MDAHLVFIIFLAVTALVLTLAAMVIASFGVTTITGAPWVRTPPESARSLLAFADLKADETVMDLGCGDGTMIIEAVLSGASRGIGYEINPLLVWWGRYRARMAGVGDKIEIHTKSFITDELPPVDVIALYLLPHTMDQLVPLISKTQKQGTRIVSRGFQFSGVAPRKSSRSKTSWMFLYDSDDLG